MDDIEDFEDEDDVEEVGNFRNRRRNPNEAVDLVLGLPPFATGQHG